MTAARWELAVIGAGPGGMEAALAAAAHGVATVLIDPNAQAGGQYYKALPLPFQATRHDPAEAEGAALRARLAGAALTHLMDTLAWGLFPAESGAGWEITLFGPDAPPRLFADQVILAPGAYDTPLALPGWTLPGVLTCGAALTLLKNQRVAPFRRVVVSGSGPLLLSAAAHLSAAGVEVLAVCEVSRLFPQALRYGLTALEQGGRLREGAGYVAELARRGVPYKLGWSVQRILGETGVTGAVLGPLAADGTPRPGRQQTLAVDAVICGYGLTPNNSLARMIDCRFDFEADTQTWRPWRDPHGQTSQAGVYLVGDGAAIGGAANARLEGRLAGSAAAAAAGKLPASELARLDRALAAPRARQDRFAAMLRALFPPRPDLIALAQDDTPLCRCEEVTLGEVRAAVAAGARTLIEVKMMTRTGMGNCQGRTCEGGLAAAIRRELSAQGLPPQTVGRLSVRPPLHPLPFAVLAQGAYPAETETPAAAHL